MSSSTSGLHPFCCIWEATEKEVKRDAYYRISERPGALNPPLSTTKTATCATQGLLKLLLTLALLLDKVHASLSQLLVPTYIKKFQDIETYMTW
jgi:hypothetical protein